MIEGDLMDLTLPTLLQALSQEQSTAQLRVQQGVEQGTLYVHEGALVHATGTGADGDEALLELLGWTTGRFRILRDTEVRPRTVTPRLTALVSGGTRPGQSTPAAKAAGAKGPSADRRLLEDALELLTKLDLDSTKVSETLKDTSGISTLLVLSTIINSLVSFVVGRTSDVDVLPSRVLSRLGETKPHTQMISEVKEELSLDTIAEMLRTWEGCDEQRRAFFTGVCEALVEVLDVYGRILGTFFRAERERQEWRATFDVFVEGLTNALAITPRIPATSGD